MKEKYLIIGKDSQIGSYLCTKYPNKIIGTTRRKDENLGESSFIYLNLEEDISQWNPPNGVTAAIILTAITSIEKCQSDPLYARFINVKQTKKLIDILKLNKIFMVFPSTNQVFDGKTPYQKIEDDISPQTEYGKNKADVESYLLNNDVNCSIIRFSKIISPENHLINSWINNLKKGMPIYPFYDMVISPIPISLACSIIKIIMRDRISGIIQVSGLEDIPYSNVAYSIAEKLGYDKTLIQPVSWKNSENPMIYVPEHTTLDTYRLTADLGIRIPKFDVIIEEIIEYHEKPLSCL